MSALQKFILKRFLSVLPVLFLVPFLTFFLMHLIPGNYFDQMRLNPQISPAVIAQYEAHYHLDQPVFVQYLHWLKRLAVLDFGYSFSYKQPVWELLKSRLANTLLLTVTSFLLAWLLAVIFGLWAGVKRGGWADRLCRITAYFGLSVPNFFLCLLLLWAASAVPGIPLGGMHSVFYEELPVLQRLLDLAAHMLIPVFVLTLASFSFLFRLMRSQTADTMTRDFVFYLHTLRLPQRKIVFKHVARNSINPMVSLFGMELPALFSSAALVEIFTGWPGLGSMMLQAVRSQDLFLVLGNMVMIAALLVAGNVLADVALVWLDPRLRTVKRD